MIREGSHAGDAKASSGASTSVGTRTRSDTSAQIGWQVQTPSSKRIFLIIRE